jgi:hypothetical protein
MGDFNGLEENGSAKDRGGVRFPDRSDSFGLHGASTETDRKIIHAGSN